MRHLSIFLLLLSFSVIAEKKKNELNCDRPSYQDIEACLFSKQKAADGALYNLTEAFKDRLGTDYVNLLKRSEQDWDSYVNSSCQLKANINKGGSLSPALFSSCILSAKERRISELGCFLSIYFGDNPDNPYLRHCEDYYAVSIKKVKLAANFNQKPALPQAPSHSFKSNQEFNKQGLKSAPPQVWSHHQSLNVSADSCAERATKAMDQLGLSSVVRQGTYTYANYQDKRAVIKCVPMQDQSFVYLVASGNKVSEVKHLRDQLANTFNDLL